VDSVATFFIEVLRIFRHGIHEKHKKDMKIATKNWIPVIAE